MALSLVLQFFVSVQTAEDGNITGYPTCT